MMKTKNVAFQEFAEYRESIEEERRMKLLDRKPCLKLCSNHFKYIPVWREGKET